MDRTFEGKLIVDAEVPILIEVTDKDIQCAIQRSETDCAIAQSLRRSQNIVSVRVGCEIVLVEYVNRWVRYVLSEDDKNKTKLFDLISMFIPGAYEILPPPEKKRMGARKGTASGSNKREGNARSVYGAPSRRHVLGKR